MQRPAISEYKNPADFIKDMIRYRKTADRGFSVLGATKGLRKLSPALVSLVIQGKRSVTVDRADEFSKLLNLNTTEKIFFRNWVGQLEGKDFIESAHSTPSPAGTRKNVSTSILSDWINVYVKDLFQLPAVQKDPSLVEKQLLPVAPPKRIARAVAFLIKEGYLRRTLEGGLVLDSRLAVADPNVPSRKIRQFHKGALSMAKLAIDLFPAGERFANTLIIPLDDKRYEELRGLIEEFSEKLKDFAARNPEEGNRLYQLIVNLSPVGGKLE
jgi:uncharacterized protein (TIGR02147 family)